MSFHFLRAPELFMRDDGYTIAKFLITEMFLGGATKGGATFKVSTVPLFVEYAFGSNYRKCGYFMVE